jgi:hypothetical protein
MTRAYKDETNETVVKNGVPIRSGIESNTLHARVRTAYPKP